MNGDQMRIWKVLSCS